MISGFWQKLKKPIFVLAPMANVTDCAFRQIIAKYGKPDIMWTEFVSCDGLCSEGRENILIDLKYSEIERPIVAQIFGAKPENFYKTALLLQELGFDGIDINMGCPDKSVSGKQGSGAALIQEPKLAQKIILETKRGAGKLPVSVKTRLGFNKNTLDTWLPNLLETEPVAITIHARTKKEMSKVPAHWEEMPNIVKFIHARTTPENRPLIIGNGDVLTTEDGLAKVGSTGCDGVMIGRGVFQNPWVFEKIPQEHTIQEKAALLLLHAKQYEKYFTGTKAFEPLKRFYKIYITGFDGAAELREELYTATTAAEVKSILTSHKLI
jgi:nifR3 family TIM-barrel protein